MYHQFVDQKKVIGWLLQHGADREAKLVAMNKRIIDVVQTTRNRKLLEVFKKCVPLETLIRIDLERAKLKKL